jgi:hypothetical protein
VPRPGFNRQPFSYNRVKLTRDETKFMLSILLIFAREIMANYLENITDGEIYPAYDIIGQILKMKKAAAAKGSCNLSVLVKVFCSLIY